MKKLGIAGVVLVFLFALSSMQFNATGETARVFAASQPMLTIDGDITEFFGLDPLAVSGANGSRDDVPPMPPEQEDFGGDGTITELYVAYQAGSLFFAVRGDMFGEPDTNFGNGELILLDIDPGDGTGAKDMDDGLDGFGDDGDPSELSDTSDCAQPDDQKLRCMISDAGTNLSPDLLMQGIGWDLAFSLVSPERGGVFSWGSAGLPGSTAEFAQLEGAFAYDLRVTPFGPGRGKPGTVIGAQDGFEVAIPVAQLGLGSGQHTIVLVAITTSKTGYPSPNQLPESTDLLNAGHGTMVIDRVAQFTFTIP